MPTNNGKDGYIPNSRATRRAWRGMLRYTELTQIATDPRWQSFPLFLADMSLRPDGTALRRHDETQGFYPSNCAWMPILAAS